MDSTLAILTKEEHRLGDMYKVWHPEIEAGEGVQAQIAGGQWAAQKAKFWKDYLEMALAGGI